MIYNDEIYHNELLNWIEQISSIKETQHARIHRCTYAPVYLFDNSLKFRTQNRDRKIVRIPVASLFILKNHTQKNLRNGYDNKNIVM